MARLEQRYRQLTELAAQRRARLEESRRFWKFFWDVGEEEAWMREQERLLSSEDVGRDLTSSLRLLSQHAAFRHELSGRAGPLQQALAEGRALVGQGHAGAQRVGDRLRELEERWRALGELAEERERRLRDAAALFQFQAEAAIAALREQLGALPEGFADVAGVAGRLPALERRYRELWEQTERRRTELQDALTLYTMRSEADACGLWVGEKEQWLQALLVPEKLEDRGLCVCSFETLEPEMNNMASRVAAVNRVADQLLASDQRNQESIRTTREQLNASWERFRSLADRKKDELSSALNIQNFYGRKRRSSHPSTRSRRPPSPKG